jgi:hypothetical protein
MLGARTPSSAPERAARSGFCLERNERATHADADEGVRVPSKAVASLP